MGVNLYNISNIVNFVRTSIRPVHSKSTETNDNRFATYYIKDNRHHEMENLFSNVKLTLQHLR